MPRRPTPPPEAVRDVLAPIRRARTRKTRADADYDDAIRAAAAAEPRPTLAQIGEAAGIREGTVRYILRGKTAPERRSAPAAGS